MLRISSGYSMVCIQNLLMMTTSTPGGSFRYFVVLPGERGKKKKDHALPGSLSGQGATWAAVLVLFFASKVHLGPCKVSQFWVNFPKTSKNPCFGGF